VIDMTLWVVGLLLLEPDSDTRASTPVKGKSIPIQDWIGLHGPRKLRIPEFLDGRHMKVLLSSLRTS